MQEKKNKKTKTVFSVNEHVERLKKEKQKKNLWFKKEKLSFPCIVPLGWRVSVTVSCDWL